MIVLGHADALCRLMGAHHKGESWVMRLTPFNSGPGRVPVVRDATPQALSFQKSLPAIPMAAVFASGVSLGISHPEDRMNPPSRPAFSMHS